MICAGILLFSSLSFGEGAQDPATPTDLNPAEETVTTNPPAAETTDPAESETPAPSGSPEASVSPETSESPAASESPAPSGSPDTSVSPEVSESPAPSEDPEGTEDPDEAEEEKELVPADREVNDLQLDQTLKGEIEGKAGVPYRIRLTVERETRWAFILTAEQEVDAVLTIEATGETKKLAPVQTEEETDEKTRRLTACQLPKGTVLLTLTPKKDCGDKIPYTLRIVRDRIWQLEQESGKTPEANDDPVQTGDPETNETPDGTEGPEQAGDTEETETPDETEIREEAGDPEATEDAGKDVNPDGAENPEKTEETDDTEPEETEEPEETAEPVAFEAQQTVSGVVVTVEAEPGAFPAGSVLVVKRVPVYQARQADAAIDEIRDEEQTVVVSYTFDIQVQDAEGNELQPAEGKRVSVTFALAETADENLEANVYHVTEENGELTAEKLEAEVDAEAETVTAQTDGFSLYTVEFTYNTLQYVLEGGKATPLSEILSALELSGTAEAVSVSNPALFSASVSGETGEWMIYSWQAFSTEEWMKVTIAGVIYEITVTDATDGQITTYNVSTADELKQYAEGSDNAIIKLTKNIKVNKKEIIIAKTITLDLNGYTLYTEDDKSALAVDKGGDLTIMDSSAAKNGKIKGFTAFGARASKITLNNATLEKLGGLAAIVLTEGSTFTMNSGTITGCQTLFLAGGAINIDNQSTFIMNGGTITKCNAIMGGAVGVDGGTFIMNDGVITYNGAYDSGGAVYMDGGTVTIKNGKFYDNFVEEEDGGAINVKTGMLNIEGGTFYDNVAGMDADGDRTDADNGGAIHMEAGVLNITGGTFSKNKADNNGGAFYLKHGVTATIKNCVIDHNSVHESTSDKGFGGAIYNAGTLYLLENVTIKENTANRNGGGIYNTSEGKLYVQGKSEISKNTTGSYGGAGICNKGETEISGESVVKDNTAMAAQGAGILNSGTLRLEDCTISGNKAVLAPGGGIYNSGTVRCSGKTTIKENHAGTKGGGICMEEGSSLFVQSEPIIQDNTQAADKAASNVFLSKSTQRINISSRLKDTAKIGVRSAVTPTINTPVILTSHLNQTGYGDETNFTSDNPIYWIGLRYEEAVLWPSSISFEPGDPNTTGKMDPVTADTMTLVLPACGFTHTQGRAFLGWMIDGDAENVYPAYTEIPINGNMVATAIWETPWRSVQKNIDNAADGGTVTIGENTAAETNDVALVIPENKKITIDLKGFELNRNLKKPAENGCAIRVMNGAKLTITDSAGTGKITGGYTSTPNGSGGISVEGGSLEIRGGTISGNKSTSAMGKDIYLNESQSVTLSGRVTIGDLHIAKENAIILSGALDSASSISVSFDWISGFRKYITSGFGSQADRVTLVQSFRSKVSGYGIGVDMTDAAHPEAYIDTAVTVSFEEIDNMPDIILAKGSSFTIPVCDKANRPGATSNGYWEDKKQGTRYYNGNTENPELITITVDEDLTLVAVWEMTWKTLQETIISAGQTPVTIKLNDDLEADEDDYELTIQSGQQITVDLNGHVLNRATYGWPEKQGHVFYVQNGGKLTIADSAGDGYITGGYDTVNGGGIYVQSGATVIMTGGTVTQNDCIEVGHGAGVYVENGATFKLDGPVQIVDNGSDNVYLEKSSADGTNDALITTGFSFRSPETGMIFVSSAILPSDEHPIVYLTKGLDFAEADYTAFDSDNDAYAIGEGEGGEAVLGERAYIYLLDETSEIRVMKPAAKGGVYTIAAATFVAKDEVSSFVGWRRVEKQNNGTYMPVGDNLLTPGGKMPVDSDRIYLQAVFGDGINYIDQYGNPLFRKAGEYTPISTLEDTAGDPDTPIAIGPGWYAVTTNQTFKNHRLQIRGKVNLILSDSTELQALKGINLPEGSELHVWCQEGRSGKLTATTATFDQAGIGGNHYEAGGVYVQHGGNVTAEATRGGAGLGGGNGRNTGNITIYSGRLTAQGGMYAAGIGSGYGGSQSAAGGGSIVIWGGTVTATGGNRGAGIGGGQRYYYENDVYGGDGGLVSIWGGTVKAQGGYMAAGIGGGVAGHGGKVTIGGGCTVEAIAGDLASEAQAIGHGGKAENDAQARDGHDKLKEETLRLGATCTVIAGDSRAEAEQVPESMREESCRLPYAKITSGKVAQYLIGVTPNVHVETKVYKAEKAGDTYKTTDTEITTADPGDLFAVVVETDEDSWLMAESVKATYVYSTETPVTELARTDETESGHIIRQIIYYTMPRGDVTVTITPEVSVYRILYPTDQKVGHGSIEILVNGIKAFPTAVNSDQQTVNANRGDMVTIQINIPEAYENYFVDKVEIKDANQQDVKKRMGQDEDKWIFSMPSSDVTINVTLGEGVTYIDQNGIKQVRRYFHTVTSAIKEIKNNEGLEDGWYVFEGNLTFNDRVKIKGSVRLILKDNQTLTFKKGITVYREDGASLTIYAQHIDTNLGNTMGTIIAKGNGTDYAGIGTDNEDCGAITINGGNINATGDDDGPGIGAGDRHNYDPIIIRNARVIAQGGEDGAGIGSGKHGKSGQIEIHSGYIDATGGKYGAGIGSGNQGTFDGSIKIYGGTVFATGGEDAAGIGAGKEANATGGKVTIEGGDIRIYSDDGGAGIGTGSNRDCNCEVTISGGDVTIRTGKDGAGIGGGNKGKGGKVTISGGTVTIYSENGACIGGGNKGDGGNVIISGGRVFMNTSNATGPMLIGKGADASNRGTVSIYPEAMILKNEEKYSGDLYPELSMLYSVTYPLRENTIPTRKGYFGTEEHIVIMPCDHRECSYKEKDYALHTIICDACLATTPIEEAHVYGNDHDPDCDLCGFNRQRTLVIDREPQDSGGITVLYKSDEKKPFANLSECLIGVSYKLKVNPAEGYKLAHFDSEYTKNKSTYVFPDMEIYSQDDKETIYEFTMPPADKGTKAKLSLRFEKIPYRTYINKESAEQADFTPNPNPATVGETVLVSVTPKDNKKLLAGATITRNDNDSRVEIVEIKDGVIRFHMPASDVTVSAQFADIPDVYWVLPVSAYPNDQYTWPANFDPNDRVHFIKQSQTGSIYTVVSYEYPEQYYPAYYRFGYDQNLASTNEYSGNRVYIGQTINLSNAYGPGAPAEGNKLFIYCLPQRYTLTFYQDIYGKLRLKSCLVPFGTPLSKVVEKEGVNEFAEYFGLEATLAGWAKTPKQANEDYDYHETLPNQAGYTLVDLANTTMPAQAMPLYPVLVKHRVRVILDLGAYDKKLNDDPSIAGLYYPNKLLETNTAATATPAYMDELQLRSFMVNSGETIKMNGEANSAQSDGMNQAYRTGYGLTGWYTKSGVKWAEGMSADPVYCDSTTATKETGKNYSYYTMTLTAHWALRWANVVYDLDGGKIGEETGPITADEAVIPNGRVEITLDDPTPPLKNNQTQYFVGWQDITGGLYQYGDSFSYRNMDFVTTPGEHPYSFPNGNTPPTAGNNIIKLKAIYELVPEGKGWVVFSTGEKATSIMPAPVTIPEGSSEANFKIVYSGDYFNFQRGENDPYELSSSIQKPVKPGFTFDGWTIKQNNNGIISYSVPASITVYKGQGTTLYARYTEKQYSITYKDKGEEIATDFVYYGHEIQSIFEPVDFYGHYQFAGWLPALPEYMPDENLEVNATWTPVIFHLTLEANGGMFAEGENPVATIIRNGAYGTTILEPDEPTREGFVFCGWMPVKENGDLGNVEKLPEFMPDTNPTYKACWRELTAPSIEETTGDAITVTVAEGQEYTIVPWTEGMDDTAVIYTGNWQTAETGAASITFDGLKPVTKYRVYTRFADVSTIAALNTIKYTDGSTVKLPQDAPSAPILTSGNRTVTVTNTELKTNEYRIQWKDESANWPENVWVSADSNNSKGIVYRKDTGDGMTELTAEEIKALPYAARVLSGEITFINLSPDQPYAVVARKMETDEYEKSDVSEASEVYTTKNNLTYVELQGEPEYGQTLTAAVDPGVRNDPMLSFRWYRDDELITLPDADGNPVPVSGNRYTIRSDDAGHMIRVVATQDFNSGRRIVKEDTAGPARKLDNDAIPDKVDATTTPTTLKVKSPVDANGGGLYEYSMDLVNWQTDILFEGLEEETDYTVYARYAATESHDASRPSEPATFRTTKVLLKTVSIDGEAVYGEQLDMLIEPADARGVTWQWFRDGEPITNEEGDPWTETFYVLTEADIGCLISVVATQPRRDNDPVIREAVVGPVQKAKQDAPENLEADVLDYSLEVTEPLNGDGTGHEYEYRINGGNWQDSPLFEGLTPNTYYIVYARVKETPTHFPSLPISRIYRTKPIMTEVYEVCQDTEGKWNEPEAYSEKVIETYTIPSKEGFTAAGYSYEYTAAEEERIEGTEAETIRLGNDTRKLYIYYARNIYRIAFMDGDTLLAEKELYYGAKITAPANPTKTGYLFSKWNPAVPETMPAAPKEGLIIQAVWTAEATPTPKPTNKTSGGSSSGSSTKSTTSSAVVMFSRFTPDTGEEDEARKAAAEQIAKVRDQYGKAYTLLIGSFDPAEVLEAAGGLGNIAVMAKQMTDAGYDALIPAVTTFDGETVALCNELAKRKIAVLAANVYYDGTDGKHEAGENVFEPYIVKSISVNGHAHKIGILSLICRGSDDPEIFGLLFSHPDNEDGSIASEAALYLPEMQDEECEFIIVCCLGQPEVIEETPEGQPKDKLSPAEQMVRQNMAIDLLLLPEASKDVRPAATMTDRTNRQVPVLREGEEPVGCVLELTEDSTGDLLCKSVKNIEQ